MACCVKVSICSLDLVSKFWSKQNFFDKKDFDCNNNFIYPTFFFCWLLQFFFVFLATINIQEQQGLNTIIHFYLCLQTFRSVLTIRCSRCSVYKLPGKMENSTFLTQICLKNGLRFGISKTNLRIRNSILQI